MKLKNLFLRCFKAMAFCSFLSGSVSASILLIEDQAGFGTLADDLRADGYAVTVRNFEFANGYANLLNSDFLDDFSLIIYGERGTGDGSLLPAAVGTSLKSYIQNGGNLLVTGYDTLASPTDPVLQSVVRVVASSDLASYNPNWTVVADHPITNGPYGDFAPYGNLPGASFIATGYDDDQPVFDSLVGTIEIVATGSPRQTAKIIMSGTGAFGSVAFWNGGLSGTSSNAQPDFTDNGNPEAMFRNYVAMIEGPGPGLAGADISVADFDGDGLVTQTLDGSGARHIFGNIATWEWTWDGGSASGETPEATFPATNAPLTVTLTATEDGGTIHTDVMAITVFTKASGLFTDFRNPIYAGLDSTTAGSRLVGTLEGDTLVIDPIGPGVPDVFRRAAGVWSASPFTQSVTDIRAIDDTTLVSGDFATGSNYQAHRLVAGEWVASPLNHSAPPPPLARVNHAFDPAAAVFVNRFTNQFGHVEGRVYACNWTGNDWDHVELQPAGSDGTRGVQAEHVAIDNDLIAVTGYQEDGAGALKLFRNSGGIWTHEASIAKAVSPQDPYSYFLGGHSVGNGKVVAASPNYFVTLEKMGNAWVQASIPLELTYAPFINPIGVDMDDDGKSFVAWDNLGHYQLFQQKSGSTNWPTAKVARRTLLLADLNADPNLTTTTFSGGEIVVAEPLSGVVRVFDKDAPFDTANAEPQADGGDDIATTSFDGQPVPVFLNGGATSDANPADKLEIEWTWPGGSATGRYASAMIDPAVNSIELKVTDSRGAVSRDTVMVNIEAPPVVDPGEDVVAVDSDGDGLIRLNVSATLQSSDFPVTDWSWTWSGGSFRGQSGTLTLGGAANGQPVNLAAIDANGLTSSTSFAFSLLSANPAPVILQPSGGGATDRFGAAVAIQNGVALMVAPDKPYSGVKTGATYLAQNLNGLWPQIQLSPGMPQRDAVLIDGDSAFVGSSEDTGRVVVYRKSPAGWLPVQTLSGGTDFGTSIAKSGNRLVIGAPGSWTGTVSLFEFNGTSWVFTRDFQQPEQDVLSRFGARVAIYGDVIAVSQMGFFLTSSVVLFKRVAGEWIFDTEVRSEVPSLPQFAEEYFFGQGLGLSGLELLIGSPVEGLVYRHSRVAGNWVPNGTINPNRPYFGSSISMLDNVAVVGSVTENLGVPNMIPGSATSLILRNGTWQESGYLKLTAAIDPHIVQTPNFAWSVSHDGRDLIVGAPTARNSSGVRTGKAYIYRNFAGLNPNANYEPLANTGSDISVNDTVVRGPAPGYLIIEPPGSEMVTLNGSASTDRENAIVSYEWSWPGGSASGVTADARFPVGTTVVTLMVTDDKGIVNTDSVNVTVALAQTPPDEPLGTGTTLTVNLPVAGAKWRLSSEFLWHGDGESADEVVPGATYQLEIIGYPGSAETVTTFVTLNSENHVEDLTLILPLQPGQTGVVRFPETAQGFTWRQRGETAWRNVADNGDAIADLIDATLPTGELVIDFKPVPGYATPASQLVTVQAGQALELDWSGYQRLDNFDPAKTFVAPVAPNLAGDPYQYVGMIRTPLGRGTGTVVAERVVLTAAHLFFDSSGLQWADTQWFPRQQQGARQAPPLAPRGILYQTAYAKLVAPDSVDIPVNNLPADKKEADFAVLYFTGAGAWEGGSANYLQSTPARNWLTGAENKHAVGYPQRSQPYEDRGKIFGKTFAAPLIPVDSNPLPKLYETGELFGDGGASGSALFVQPQGVTGYYPAAVLLAGQDRAVYRAIDEDVGRMIQDAQDAASGNDEVLNNNFSLVTYGGSGLRALEVSIATAAVLPTARWAVKPNIGTTYSNLTPTQRVGFNNSWGSVTVSFTAVSGYVTPPSITLLNSQVPPGGITTIGNVIYEPVSGFDLWKQARGIASDGDDRDNDGLPALIEYAINGNPDSGADPAPIRMAANPSQNVSAEFEVFVSSSAGGIRYEVKASNELDGASVATLATFTKADGTNSYKRVTDNQPRSASSKRFAWVEITHDRSLPTGP